MTLHRACGSAQSRHAEPGRGTARRSAGNAHGLARPEGSAAAAPRECHSLGRPGTLSLGHTHRPPLIAGCHNLCQHTGPPSAVHRSSAWRPRGSRQWHAGTSRQWAAARARALAPRPTSMPKPRRLLGASRSRPGRGRPWQVRLGRQAVQRRPLRLMRPSAPWQGSSAPRTCCMVCRSRLRACSWRRGRWEARRLRAGLPCLRRLPRPGRRGLHGRTSEAPPRRPGPRSPPCLRLGSHRLRLRHVPGRCWAMTMMMMSWRSLRWITTGPCPSRALPPFRRPARVPSCLLCSVGRLAAHLLRRGELFC